MASSELSFVEGEPYECADTSIWGLFMQGKTKNSNSNKPAIIVHDQTRDHLSSLAPHTDSVVPVSDESRNYLIWSYDQLHDASLQLAAALSRQGVRPGSVVVTFVWSCVEWALFRWATHRLDAVFTPLDPRIIGRREDYEDMLRLLQPDVLLFEDSQSADQAEKYAVENHTNAKVKLVCSGKDKTCEEAKCVPLEDFVLKHAPKDTERFTFPELPTLRNTSKSLRSSEDPIGIWFTSGTSSRPKGALITTSALVNMAENSKHSCPIWTLGADGAMIMQSAPFRSLCQMRTTVAWHGGGAVVFPSAHYEQNEMLKAIELSRATCVMLIPSQIYDLSEYGALQSFDLSSVKCVTLAGDVVTAGVVEKCKTLFPSAEVGPWFGMTEGIGQFGMDSLPSQSDMATKGEILALGKATSNSKIKVCDPETGKTLPRGQTGSIHFCSPDNIHGYLEGRDPEAFYKDADGCQWFISGDAAVIDMNSNIYILGRYKDIIKVAGVGLSPAILEACLNNTPDVKVSIKNTNGSNTDDLGSRLWHFGCEIGVSTCGRTRFL